jgi:hypothetical protein
MCRALQRLADNLVDDGMLGPITGVMTAPLLDLMEAAQKTSVADVDSHAYIAIMKAQEVRTPTAQHILVREPRRKVVPKNGLTVPRTLM